MNLTLKRFVTLPGSTLGRFSVDEHFQCFTLEDPPHDVKIPGKTRIPAGVYELKLRTEGKVHADYVARFPEHRGVLWLQNVPNFEWVYLHVGNTAEQTEGCILVGDTLHANGTLSDSVVGYRRVYGLISNAILAGEPVSIAVED